MTTEPGTEPHSIGAHGVTLTVRVTPKASKSTLGGIVVLPDGRRGLVRPRGRPAGRGSGQCRPAPLLSMQLAVRGSDLAIVSGETSRRKVIRLYGDGQQIACRLRHIAGAA